MWEEGFGFFRSTSVSTVTREFLSGTNKMAIDSVHGSVAADPPWKGRSSVPSGGDCWKNCPGLNFNTEAERWDEFRRTSRGVCARTW